MSNRRLILTTVLSILITALLFAVVSFRSFRKPPSLSEKPLANPEVESTSKKPLASPQYLTEKGDQLIRSTLIQPLQTKLGIRVDKKSFSRCPSGLGYYIVLEPHANRHYFQGTVENYRGCQGKRVCSFRLNEDENQLEVWSKSQHRFLGVKRWLATNEALALSAQ